MERALATVDQNGELVLPAQVQSELGLLPGTDVEITVDDNSVHLVAKAQPFNITELREALANLRTMFRGRRSLEDDLYEMRHDEEEHSLRKYGC